jgi:hypothetical protein
MEMLLHVKFPTTFPTALTAYTVLYLEDCYPFCRTGKSTDDVLVREVKWTTLRTK